MPACVSIIHVIILYEMSKTCIIRVTLTLPDGPLLHYSILDLSHLVILATCTSCLVPSCVTIFINEKFGVI